jgi:hypothetical protein
VIEEVRQYENIRRDSNDKSDWSVYLRLISLAYLLAREFDWFEGEASAQREDETWYSLWSQATRIRQQHQLNPHRPDLGGTLNFPMFNLAEHEFCPDSKEQRLDAARCEKIVLDLER